MKRPIVMKIAVNFIYVVGLAAEHNPFLATKSLPSFRRLAAIQLRKFHDDVRSYLRVEMLGPF